LVVKPVLLFANSTTYKTIDRGLIEMIGPTGIAEALSSMTKNISNLQNSSLSYSNAIFQLNDKNQKKVKIYPNHNLNNLDYVSISGLSSSLGSLNGISQIGVTSYSSYLFKDLPAISSGVATDIYVSNIPTNISIGSSIKIESDILTILNIFNTQNVIRVIGGNSVGLHTANTPIYFIPDTFTINKNVDYFDSKINFVLTSFWLSINHDSMNSIIPSCNFSLSPLIGNPFSSNIESAQ